MDERVSSLERLVFFSDAVFSVAITLLTIDIRVPNVPSAQLGVELRRLLPTIAVYALTFVVVGLYWVNHHRMYRRIVRFDYALIWLNMLVLLCVAFLPVPNAVLARYSDSPDAVMFYATALIATAMANILLWRYATRNGRHIARDVTPEVIRAVFTRNLTTVAVAAIAVIMGYWSTAAAFTLLVTYAAISVVTSIITARREAGFDPQQDQPGALIPVDHSKHR